MKNGKLLKILGIVLLVVMLLTWVIPSSAFDSYTNKVTLGAIQPFGIWDWVNRMNIVVQFWPFALLVLVVGGFYGILTKTGVMKNIISWFTKSFKGREKLFLGLTIAVFMIVTTLTGIYLPLFIFVPLFVAIILTMGYGKMVALLSTVGSIILGSMSIFYNDYLAQVLTLKGATDLWLKISILVVSIIAVVFFVVKVSSKKEPKEEIDKDLLLTETTVETKGNKKKAWPIVIILFVIFALLVIGMIPWQNCFNIKLFDDFHKAVIGVKIGNFAIFQNILGTTAQSLGIWAEVDMIVILLIASFVITLIYKIKISEAFTAFVEGMKKYLSAAIIVLLVHYVLAMIYYSGFHVTIINGLINITDKFNVVIAAITTFISNALTFDGGFVANYNTAIISRIVEAGTPMGLLALTQQAMYGLAMLIAPTSVFLLAGLAYMEIPYTKWLKYIWRLFIILLIIILTILVIASMIIK